MDISVEKLILHLDSPDYKIRKAAAEKLGELCDPATVDPLIITLGDENAEVRRAAAEALDPLGECDIARAVFDLFEGEDDSLKNLAALNDPRVVPILIHAMDRGEYNFRSTAIDALGRLRDTRALGPLLDALNDKYFGIRRDAVDALGRIGDPGIIEALVNALDDEAPWVRKASAIALGKIGKRIYPPVFEPEQLKNIESAIEKLKTLTPVSSDEQSNKVRKAAWEALKILEPKLEEIKE
ncbi:MAG: HEAT repeat domain-containing protein [Chloroflexi bacterium]|nr:HEAT repeat domain-containing protein [Chloroflexota bacterium]